MNYPMDLQILLDFSFRLLHNECGDFNMTSFLLKIIGILTMLSDHVGDAVLGKFSFLNLIGRIAFPIFAFQAVQGYLYTKNLKKHMAKLFLFACLSQIPFMLFLSTFYDGFVLNIFFTFFLGLLAIFLYDKCNHKIWGFFVVAFISIIGMLIHVDYSAFGILLIFCFYFFKDNKWQMVIATILLCFGKYLPEIFATPVLFWHYLTCAIFTCLSLCFILFYNQKEGPKANYFFYLFYPMHLLLLYFIHMAL